eukprot:6088413-Lingulodinium_polyedra.AAC.1
MDSVPGEAARTGHPVGAGPAPHANAGRGETHSSGGQADGGPASATHSGTVSVLAEVTQGGQPAGAGDTTMGYANSDSRH